MCRYPKIAIKMGVVCFFSFMFQVTCQKWRSLACTHHCVLSNLFHRIKKILLNVKSEDFKFFKVSLVVLSTKTNEVDNDVQCTCRMCLEDKHEVLNDYIKRGISSSLFLSLKFSHPCGGFCKNMLHEGRDNFRGEF